ncbi:MAG: dimethyl sulfoxide reductase anchor subunit [Alphaproteobacteria bacterium]|nr:dimethyl sulfoxide reductase anchor subunit [Alphaproteobacteria bacterium]
MFPAPSVILFTTLSGAGYGMAAVAGLLAALQPGLIDSLALPAMALSLGLIVTGLLSAVAHLGRPARAWRALSQWRSSWLSREGVMALVGFGPISGFAVAWLFPTVDLGPLGLWGIASAIVSVGTLFTTAMIYQSLKPIAQWHHSLVVPGYLILGPMTGALVIQALIAAHGRVPASISLIAVTLVVASVVVKTAYWYSIDTQRPRSTASALGLGNVTASSMEWPHTEENFLLKEMGFVIARRHARRLRHMAAALGGVGPIVLTVMAMSFEGAIVGWACGLAAVLALAGVGIERWLFFAEARHTVALYYGRYPT